MSKLLSRLTSSFFFLFIFSSTFECSAQIYAYQDLSHVAYLKQKDSLKKAWLCPTLYKEKETQKKYKEFWDSRTDFIATSIESKNFVVEKEIFNYLDGIISELVNNNPAHIKEKPLLLIDRSSVVNAYAIGGNIIAVNLGLVSFAQSREEIALVIAHELSHNILKHPDNSMKERAEFLTSEEYKNSLKAILDSKYERYSRLKKLMEGYTFNRSKHNRYHETDADSLAVILLKNSHIGFDAKFFLRLDSVDLQYKQPLKKPVNDYFTGYNLAFESWWMQKKTKGLSARNYNFRDTTNIEDSLKTHPECSVRYANTLKLSDKNIKLTQIPSSIKEKANKIIIWNMFDNLSLTACLYQVLQEKDRGNTDEWYDFMIHNIIAGLYYSDKQLNRFNAIGIKPKELISKDYYELQNTLEQIPKENLEAYYKAFQTLGFWQKLPPDARALKGLIASITVDVNNEKNNSTASKNFISQNASSMYCEFADHFQKK